MALINLTFMHEINVSVQIGDTVYFVPTNPVGLAGANGNWASTTTPHMSNARENVIEIGPVQNITPWDGSVSIIQADYADDISAQYGPPQPADFIMFSKDNKANLSSLLGYYAMAEIRNNSTEKAEMFGIAADFVESSK